MKLELESLNIENFKGIKKLDINFKPDYTTILGENGIGKTTIADSFFFLLFGTNSNGDANFMIKPIDDKGNVIHNVISSVEGRFKIYRSSDSYNHFPTNLYLKREYKEKWTKKRGQLNKELTGHTTKYYIDKSAVKKKEYDDKINSLLDYKKFKLLSDPFYFSDTLKREERRQIIMSSLGGEFDKNAFLNKYTNIDNEKISSICNKKSASDRKKELQANALEINKKIEHIPDRIDELAKGLGEDKENKDFDSIIKNLNEDLKKLRSDNTDSTIDNEILAKKKQKMEIEDSIREYEQEQYDNRNYFARRQADQIFYINNEINNIKSQNINNEKKIKTIKDDIKKLEEDKKFCNKSIEELREKWIEEHRTPIKTIKSDDVDKCIVCGQKLPEEKIDKIMSDYFYKEKKRKANILEEINKEGKSHARTVEEIVKKINKLEAEIDKLYYAGGDNKLEIQKLESDLEKEKQKQYKEEYPESYNEKVQEKKKIEDEIEKLEANKGDDTIHDDIISEKIIDKEHELEDIIREKTLQYQYSDIKIRIAHLENEQKDLGNQYISIMYDINMLEEYMRAMAEFLEDNINKEIRFGGIKLFEDQINGGLKEICDIVVNGIVFTSLNNASRIKAGLAIIDAIADKYNFFPPVWVDAAESITDLPAMKNQQLICLKVWKGQDNIKVM